MVCDIYFCFLLLSNVCFYETIQAVYLLPQFSWHNCLQIQNVSWNLHKKCRLVVKFSFIVLFLNIPTLKFQFNHFNILK